MDPSLSKCKGLSWLARPLTSLGLHLPHCKPELRASGPGILMGREGGLPASRPPREVSAHLGGHHPLPLGDQAALLALTVSPHAEALVPFQGRGVAVVPAPRALGQPGGLLPRRGGRASRTLSRTPGIAGGSRGRQARGFPEGAHLNPRAGMLRRGRRLVEGRFVGHLFSGDE